MKLKLKSFRLKDARREAKVSGIPVFYMFAGDIFSLSGSPLYIHYQHPICDELLNLLEPDVITLGDSEFLEMVKNLSSYVKGLKAPTVVANVDFKMDVCTKKSIILKAQDQKVGVIGALTPKTKHISAGYVENTVFEDEIPAINREAENLRNQGVEIIIALTHSGFQKDKMIAKECPLVDVIVGGHSHTFLYNGQIDPVHKESNAIEGPYPFYIKAGEKKVPIVHTFGYSKYIGRLDLIVSLLETLL